MAPALSVLLWGGTGLLAAAAAYLWAWALVGLCPPWRKFPSLRCPRSRQNHPPSSSSSPPTTRPPASRTCSKASKPRTIAHYEIWVIADNCTDNTASLAEAAGARCLVRTDPEHPGKGQAMQFAFAHSSESRADAVVIIDADSVVNEHFLSALAASLGDRYAEPLVRQASSRLRPGESAQSLLLAAESALEDRLYYGAKGRLGFPVLLRGGGMCFTRALLRAHPWNAGSVGEDVEYATSSSAPESRRSS